MMNDEMRMNGTSDQRGSSGLDCCAVSTLHHVFCISYIHVVGRLHLVRHNFVSHWDFVP